MGTGEVTAIGARSSAAGAMGVQCYVRVTCPDHRGYVEFQFAIGDPSLVLDMTLPAAAFAEFCATHRALALDAATRETLERARPRPRLAGLRAVHEE